MKKAQTIELDFVLHELPSAQHKAGLAGLWVLLDLLRDRRKTPRPVVLQQGPGQLKLGLTRDSLQTLLDELYDGEKVLVPSRSKWGKQKPVRVQTVVVPDSRTGKNQAVRQFIYRQVVPKGDFLRKLGLDPIWVKLWRETIWSTLRGIPMTRIPYEQRAAGKHATLAAGIWSDLDRERKRAAEGGRWATEPAGGTMIGAQAHNAEDVPVIGSPAQNFLLHFWQVVMTCWVPEIVDRDGQRQHVGFAIAVPEVADLEDFVESFRKFVPNLRSEPAGFRPRDALVSLPEEGALEYLRHLGRIVATKGKIEYSVFGVEVFHLRKKGNTIPILHAARLPANPDLVERYELLRSFRHPLFRGQLIRNLLADCPWFRGFDRQFAIQPRTHFFARDFTSDARRKFADHRPSRTQS